MRLYFVSFYEKPSVFQSQYLFSLEFSVGTSLFICTFSFSKCASLSVFRVTELASSDRRKISPAETSACRDSAWTDVDKLPGLEVPLS